MVVLNVPSRTDYLEPLFGMMEWDKTDFYSWSIVDLCKFLVSGWRIMR